MSGDILKILQAFVISTLEKECLTVNYRGLPLHNTEVADRYSGLPRLIQQALIIDYTKLSTHVWDNGLFLEPEDTLTGFKVVYRKPKKQCAKYPLLAMVLTSIDIAKKLSGSSNVIDLDDLPVTPAPAYFSSMIMNVDWDEMQHILDQKLDGHLKKTSHQTLLKTVEM